MATKYTPRQRRVEARVRRHVGDGAAEYFLAALAAASDEAAHARSTNVWHMAREADNSLLWVLGPLVDDVAWGQDPDQAHDAEPEDIFEKDPDARAKRVAEILAALELDATDEDLAWWCSKVGFHRLAHRRHLLAPRAFDPTMWDRYERVLDRVLDAFEAKYGDLREMLDALLAKGRDATKDDTLLLCRIPPSSRAVALRHFFEQADASWLPRLPKCLFATPPGPLAVLGEPGYVSLPGSPLTRYLARVSRDDPRGVAARISQLLAKGTPDSPWAQADLADASLNLSPGEAAAWARQASVWLRGKEFFFPGPERRLSAAASSLIERDEVEPGIELARELLSLDGPKRAGYGTPSSKLGEHEYEDALAQLTAALASVAPTEGLAMVADLLARALDDDPTKGQYSRLWLTRVGSDEEDPTILFRLAMSVHELAVAAAKASDPATVADGLWERSGRTAVFRRIALAVLARVESRPTSVARLSDASTYVDETAQEARDVLAVVAPTLTEAEYEAVDHAIAEATLAEDTKDRLRALLDGDPSGSASEIEPMIIRGGFVRVESPVTADELARWPVDEIARYASTWQAPEGSWTVTRAGLGSALEQAAKANSRKFSEGAVAFADVPPDMLMRLLWGFREVAREEDTLAWPAVLDLISSLVRRAEWPTADWEDVRRGVATVFAYAYDAHPVPISTDLADQVLAVIGILAADASPSVHEAPQGARRDWVMAALNGVRSKAVQLAVRYARWLSRAGGDTGQRGLPPAVRDILDEHLDGDPAPAVRCAYGMELPGLALVDEQWVRDRLEDLFATEPAATWEGIWAGYLSTPWRTDDLAFAATRPAFRRRVEAVGQPEPLAADEELGHWLAMFYWRGFIELDDPDDLLAAFFHRAPAEVAREVVHWVGWSFWSAREGSPDQGGLRRLPAFWEWRSAEAERDGRLEELGTFSWWFASGLFDQEWANAQLERVVRLDAALDLPDIVADRLLALAEARERDAARLAELILSRDANDERMYGRDGMAALVRRLAESDDPEVRDAATRLRNRYLARGFPDPL